MTLVVMMAPQLLVFLLRKTRTAQFFHILSEDMTPLRKKRHRASSPGKSPGGKNPLRERNRYPRYTNDDVEDDKYTDVVCSCFWSSSKIPVGQNLEISFAVARGSKQGNK
mmetsp:Transcript_59375/g.64114  ORF Transcript_59375/g.64114 Transcript_59375/m.64114 type:complete len:110 (-) Transcript_59375:1100-1429(-)